MVLRNCFDLSKVRYVKPFFRYDAFSILSTRKYSDGSNGISKYSLNDQIYIHDSKSSKQDKVSISLSPKENCIPIGTSKTTEITSKSVIPNPDFVQLLHSRISEVVHKDLAFIIEAGTYANSFMPIYDFREIPRYGRVPEVDSIFGYVQVDADSKIIPGSYESNDMYRLCNAAGLIKLSDFLYSDIRAKCERND